jgi:NDP-sugar pyrophosphorylase family protein
MTKDIAIVYMVAGISSRFGGKIKQFAKVGPNDETLIEYSLKQALAAGFTKIVFIVGNKTEEPFKEKFGDNFNGIPVLYARQGFDPEERDRPWGTCDAVCTVKDVLDCPFVVCNGDDLYGIKVFKILYDHLQNSEEAATVGYRLEVVLPESGTVNRGIFEIDENNCIKAITEAFNISREDLKLQKLSDSCSMNIFALYPETVSLLTNKLESFKEQNKGDRKIECLIQHKLTELIQEKRLSIKLYPVSEPWIGVTNPGDEEKVKEFLIKEWNK